MGNYTGHSEPKWLTALRCMGALQELEEQLRGNFGNLGLKNNLLRLSSMITTP
jgi:hypothetical protein